MRRVTLSLSAEQRSELQRMRDHDRRPYLRECAAALLKVADGQAPYQVAAHGLLKPRHKDTVYGWVHKYQQDGIQGVRHRPRGHRGYSPRPGRAVAAGRPAAT